jgi:hypothetical protein
MTCLRAVVSNHKHPYSGKPQIHHQDFGLLLKRDYPIAFARKYKFLGSILIA